MFRKPGPAMSTAATPGTAARRSANTRATSRGGMPTLFASCRAMLVAQSPCSRERGRSTVTCAGTSAVANESAPSATAAVRTVCSAWESSAGVTGKAYRARRAAPARIFPARIFPARISPARTSRAGATRGGSDPARPRIRPLEEPRDARRPRRGVDCLSPDLGGGMTRRTNLIDQAVARLRQQIISGAWPVGARIPPEPELTELVGVGRNTVREAVQSLVHAGMLERRQGSGTYVISDSELGTAMGREIDGAHQRDVLEVRRSLEVECARLAAQRRTAEQVTELRDLRDRRAAARASGDLDVMVAADLVLHRTIAVAAKNPVLLALYENLQDAITANIRFNFEHLVGDDDAHSLLVEAIAAGDTVAAMAEIDDYLSEFIGDDPVA